MVFLAATSTSIAHAGNPPFAVRYPTGSLGPPEPYAPGELLVQFRPATAKALRQEVLARHAVTPVRGLLLSDVELVRFDPTVPVLDMARQLQRDPTVAMAEPNYARHAEFTPNDTYYQYQWHFPLIQLPLAWDRSTGSGVTVAVIDTGVAYETYDVYVQAPDLAGTTFVTGWDYVNNDAHPNDDSGHGTHVAGTIAQTTNNSLGVAGGAYQAQIMPVKVLNDKGSGYDADVADGIVWATDHGAQVINMSLGGPSAGAVLQAAVEYAYNHGVVVVAAAGNNYCQPVDYPAAYPQVIAVAAVRYDRARAPYSNCGPELDVAAPGGDLNVDQNGDGYPDGILQQTFSAGDYGNFGYWFYQGTSMATPHVAAAAALLISAGYAVTPDAVRAALVNTALDLGTAGFDNDTGWGLIQVNDALTYAENHTPATPTATTTAVATATTPPTATATPTATTPPTATSTPTATVPPTATSDPTAPALPSTTATSTATVAPSSTATPTPGSCALAGDLNCDCTIDELDLATEITLWGTQQGTPAYNATGDLNGDGVIDLFDVMFIAAHYHDQCTP
jgi:serine protease